MKYFVILFFLVFLQFSTSNVYAYSSYVLPYPATMPGTVWYKLHLALEMVEKYWYFGNFGQFTYNLKESDKYIVEAKTLFEYKQYLLGYDALKKSDDFFRKVPEYLTKAKREGRDITEKQNILKSASLAHDEVLHRMLHDTPESFQWSPEKAASSDLPIHTAIEASMKLRGIYE